MFLSKDMIEVYSLTLSQQKQIIKTNAYARELELKYHKRNHHYYPMQKSSEIHAKEEFSQWPIESTVFTRVLKSKLQDIPNKKRHIAKYSKKMIKEIKESLNVKHFSENSQLPKLGRARYWSPPNFSKTRMIFFKDTSFELAPQVQKIKYSSKLV